MAWYPRAVVNKSPASCYGAVKTTKIAVCDHHMGGFAKYLRNFDHLKEGKRISAHFTSGMDGSIQQHVDTNHVAWTQGLRDDNFKWFVSIGLCSRSETRIKTASVSRMRTGLYRFLSLDLCQRFS